MRGLCCYVYGKATLRWLLLVWILYIVALIVDIGIIFVSSEKHRHYEKTLKSSGNCFIYGKLLRHTNKVSPRFLLRDTLHEARWGGGKLLPINSLKWNPNDVLTTCKAISKGLASGFVYWSCALSQKPLINGLEKKQKTWQSEAGLFLTIIFW